MNEMDKILKHKLEHHHVDIPEGAWENIASRLPAPNRTLRPWWALTSVLFVLFISGLTSYFMSGFSENIPSNLNKIQSGKQTAFTQFFSSQNEECDPKEYVSSENKFINRPVINLVTEGESIYLGSKPFNQINDNNAVRTNIHDNNSFTSYDLGSNATNRSQIYIESLKDNYLNGNQISYSRTISYLAPFAKEKPAKACPFVLDVKDKSVDIYYSNDFVSKSLTSSSSLTEYKNMRLSTETPMYSFSAGARFGYNLSYRWNIHTGFNYSQINEKFEYVDPESNQTRIITIKDYVYDNGKIVDSVITEETVLVPGTTTHTVYNKYRTFDIPVLGRYTIYANKHFSISGVTGIYFNISMQEKGMILSVNNNKPISLSSTDDEGKTMFKTQLGLTGYGALSLAYHITPRIDFLFEPNIRIQTESMSNDTYPIAQRFNSYSISTGLRYKF